MKRLTTSVLTQVLSGFSLTAISADWQALPDQAPAPADNPTTPAKVELGKMLYMDPRFSSTGTVSCNTCHNVMLGGEDNRPFSMGVHGQMGGRSAPPSGIQRSARCNSGTDVPRVLRIRPKVRCPTPLRWA